MPVSRKSWPRRTFALLTGAAVAVSMTALGGTPAQAEPDGLKLVATNQSLLGTHYWYQQVYQGHPVLGGFYARHVDAQTGAVEVTDGRVKVGPLNRTLSAVAEDS